MQRPVSREYRSCFTSLSASEGGMAAAQVNVDYDSVQPFIVNRLHDADVTKTTRLLAILWSFWFDGNKFCWQAVDVPVSHVHCVAEAYVQDWVRPTSFENSVAFFSGQDFCTLPSLLPSAEEPLIFYDHRNIHSTFLDTCYIQTSF
ncbi:hypothetical protein GOBAR_AA37946 [Gossypium barbadense]|uniref:Uncharacterized protein n=1 Tax=Gossypium barbadense TaxID=3634 RepID=A0A2P5VV88_GOSBA|nr:hypothetical protein GOBAR_AA37946 [Gossypium barbadense]